MDRRRFLIDAGGGLALSLGLPRGLLAAGLPAGTIDTAVMEALAGKAPLIKRSFRPPNYETPVESFTEAITPNDRFFVRFHLAHIPEVGAADWRLRVGGEAAKTAFELTLEELKRDFPTVELVAVCQCSGNRRGLSDPHVPGVQWGYGAMGNARWTGVRLKDILARANLRAEAVEIAFDGADSGVVDKTPDFIKSLPVWKAQDDNTLVAWAMNGEPLPHWHGFPARLVVAGWTGTYWVKALTSIEALARPYGGFWMNPAYRIPKGRFPIVDRFLSQEAETTTPITEMVVNSVIAEPRPGQRIAAGRPLTVRGVAWDGGYGIRSVDVSVDGGRYWQPAELGADLGRYGFRAWRHVFTPQRGHYVISARATNRIGASQTFELVFNPAGYHNNVIEQIEVTAT